MFRQDIWKDQLFIEWVAWSNLLEPRSYTNVRIGIKIVVQTASDIALPRRAGHSEMAANFDNNLGSNAVVRIIPRL